MDHVITVKSLQVLAAQKVCGMIADGKLKIGQRLKEADLCRSLGISRTPVRDALKTLQSEGIVEIIPNKGAFVAEPDLKEIKDMFEMMSLLEGYSAGIVAREKLTEENLETLEEMHRDLKSSYQQNNLEKCSEINISFHKYLAELSNNKHLSEMILKLQYKNYIYRSCHLYWHNRLDKSLKEHEALMRAFRQKDYLEAEIAMRTHLLNQYEEIARHDSDFKKDLKEAHE